MIVWTTNFLAPLLVLIPSPIHVEENDTLVKKMSLNTMVSDITYAVFLWTIVFIPSSILGGIIGSRITSEDKSVLSSGLITQILFIVLSFFIAYLFKLNNTMTFTIDQKSLIICLIASTSLLIVSLIMNYINKKYTANTDLVPTQLFNKNKTLTTLTLLIIAPLGEEILFRGLLEGYLIIHKEPIYVTVIIPALLFMLVHLQPLKKHAILLSEVFITGLLLSYLRTTTNSLIPVIVAHSAMNTGGIITYKLSTIKLSSRKTANYKVLQAIAIINY